MRKNPDAGSPREKMLLWAMYIPVCMLMLQLLLYKITGTEERNAAIHSAVMLASAVPMIFSALIWIRSYSSLRKAIAAYAAVFMLFAVQFLIFPKNREYLADYIFKVFFISVPLFINCSSIKNECLELNVLNKICLFVFSAGTAYSLFIVFEKAFTEYSMSFGYYMLFPACFFSYIYFTFRKKIFLLLSALTAVAILGLGSRGPLIIWAFYFASLILLSDISKISKVFFAAAAAAVVLFKNGICGFLVALLNDRGGGMQSRTLNLISSGKLISHDSGRSVIQEKAFEMIRRRPIFGNGIGADYRVIGGYPHNIFIEIVLQFGVIFGGILLAGLVYIIVRGFIKAGNRKLYLFYFCIGFLPLIVSGTYLTDMSFWLFLGYALRENNLRAKEIKPTETLRRLRR